METDQAPPAGKPASPAVSPHGLWWRRGDGLRLLLATVLCVCLAALVTWVPPYFGVPNEPGPLYRGGGHGSALDGYDVGDRFTYGVNVLTMPRDTDDTAVVTDVKVVGLDPGLRYLGARLGSPERTETWQVVHRWPPRGPVHDVVPLSTPITSRSADGMGWELFLGFEVTKPGYWVSDGWEITYEVNGRTYRYVEPAEMVVCTPEALTKRGECLFPDERDR